MLVGCRAEEAQLTNDLDGGDGMPTDAEGSDKTVGGRLWQWRLDLATGQCVDERMLCDVACDFPQVDASRVGRYTRYIYAAEFLGRSLVRERGGDANGITGDGPEGFLVIAALKHDLETGVTTRHVYRSSTGHEQLVAGEAMFVPRPSRDPLHPNGEDDGYV